jgi:hypothetical protein
MDIDALVESLPDPVVNLISDLQDEVTTLTKSLEEAEARFTAEEPPADPIAKALEANPEIAAILKSKDDEMAEIRKTLEATRIEKANESWIAKARSFDGVVDNPEVFGPVLREIADTNQAHADLITKALSAASERIRLSDLFSEQGHSASVGVSSAYEQATAIAKSMVDSGQSETIEEARATVWDSNPHLYVQYQSERQSR